MGEEKEVGIDEIRNGMDQISTGFPSQGIRLLRNGRADLFEKRHDPFYASLIDISLREEARAELLLAASSTGIQRQFHLESAEKLLSGLAPSLEVHLLELDLLQAQGKSEKALQKVDGFLQGDHPPLERGLLLFAKGRLLSEDPDTFEKALVFFETAHYEGEETQKIRLALARNFYQRGEITEALRTLSKIVNGSIPSPLISEALNLRGKLLEQIGRADLKERQKTCGN